MSGNPFACNSYGNPFDADNEVSSNGQMYVSPKERALASQQRAIASIGNSEQVGVNTLEELCEQGEKIDRAEERLKQIGELQKDSQRQINSLNSWFKGWFSKKKPDQPQLPSNPTYQQDANRNKVSPANAYLAQNPVNSSSYQARSFIGDDKTQAFDSNMDQMSAGMARLKNLASTMNAELKAQNEQLDRLDPTISRVSDTMGTQNRQMNKLLGVRGSR